MKVKNIHTRIISANKQSVSDFVETIASGEDKIWPHEWWPRMKLDSRFAIGSKGGHGIIKYFVSSYIKEDHLEFTFTSPSDFKGMHSIQLRSIENNLTEVVHTINMTVSGIGILFWISFVRRFHDALIEDAFDKLENHFSNRIIYSPWSLGVRCWRFLFGLKSKVPHRSHEMVSALSETKAHSELVHQELNK